MREQAKTPESSFQRVYLRQKKREREQVRVFRALLLVSFLVLWEVAADLRWIDPFIFSSPVRVGKTFVTLLTEQNLLRHIGITVYETGISFLLVSTLGMAFAVLLWLFPRFSAVMEPYLVVLNSLPKSALAPLLIVWMGANVKTIITAGISVAIFGSVISIYSSFQSVEPDMLRLIATLGGTKKDMLFRAVVVSGAARRVEGQHRSVPRRCCNRRVYRGKRGAWLSDYLRQSGVQICTRKRREDDR